MATQQSDFGKALSEVFPETPVAVAKGDEQAVGVEALAQLPADTLATRAQTVDPETRARELFVDPVSGLRTRRAWDQSPRKPKTQVAVITSPDIKALNDLPEPPEEDAKNPDPKATYHEYEDFDMPENKVMKEAAAFLMAAAEATRLNILKSLATGTKNVTELAKAMQVEIVNVSHHLGVMRQAGLVEDEKMGRFSVYKIKPGVGTVRDDKLVLTGPGGVTLSIELA